MKAKKLIYKKAYFINSELVIIGTFIIGLMAVVITFSIQTL